MPPDWHRQRQRIKNRDKVCQIAGPDCTVTIDEIDHIGDRFDHRDENLRGACRTCHRARTQQQAAAGVRAYHARRKRPQERHPGLK